MLGRDADLGRDPTGAAMPSAREPSEEELAPVVIFFGLDWFGALSLLG